VLPSSSWEEKLAFTEMCGGGGSCLYTPHCLSKTLQEKEELLKECEDNESPRIKKRLKITQMALERAYADLETATK
jgi:hypothetical protein